MPSTPHISSLPTLVTETEHVSVDWVAVQRRNAVKVDQFAWRVVAVDVTHPDLHDFGTPPTVPARAASRVRGVPWSMPESGDELPSAGFRAVRTRSTRLWMPYWGSRPTGDVRDGAIAAG
jgi:hypothetical protein